MNYEEFVECMKAAGYTQKQIDEAWENYDGETSQNNYEVGDTWDD